METAILTQSGMYFVASSRKFRNSASAAFSAALKLPSPVLATSLSASPARYMSLRTFWTACAGTASNDPYSRTWRAMSALSAAIAGIVSGEDHSALAKIVADNFAWVGRRSHAVAVLRQGPLGVGRHDLKAVDLARIHGAVQRIGGGGDPDQHQHDQAHALLSVVGTVRKAHTGAGENENGANQSGGGVFPCGPGEERRHVHQKFEQGAAAAPRRQSRSEGEYRSREFV